jgi:thiamine kinase-like enzyme
MDPDAAFYIDVPTSFLAARRASNLEVGPRVYSADEASGVLVMEDLDAGWRVGTLERLLDPKIVGAVFAARRKFQGSGSLPKSAGVFDEIERFYADAKGVNAQLPVDVDWLVDELRFAHSQLKGANFEAAPIHADGNVSNIMISDSGDVRLVDWDRATTADPLEDVGSFMVEAFEQEAEARDAFDRNFPELGEAAFNRARIYGVADDLRWGLIGAVVAAKSPRNTHEFYKFASWRFLRCRMQVRAPRFGEQVRRMA